MPRNSRHEQALTVMFIGVIAFLFIFQARIALQPNHHLSFDIQKMNVAFGYGSSSSSSSVGVETGNCTNAFDDDSDGFVDCDDSDCTADVACVSSSSSSSSSIACGGTSGADQTLLYSSHCYMLFTSSDKTWANAKTACATYSGSYLASITASGEQSQIVSGFSFGGTSTFIGLNDRTTEGTYVWDHGDTLSYTNWGSGQPNNSGDQDCAALSQTYSYAWDDTSCTTTNDYLCEMSMTATCGNSVRENAEACDDGDTSSGDGCSATCTIESGWSCSGAAPTTCVEVCGNGVITTSETCDDGNASNGDGCSSSCAEESGWQCTGAPSSCATDCGDGIVAGSETCDDGNVTDTDACRNTCVFASCGDSVVQANGADGVGGNADDETCDDGGESATCDDNCSAVACGDQNVNEAAGEGCDDGNSSNLDACLNSCTVASCGDGYIRNAVEACEPPGVDTCNSNCQEARGIGGTSTYEESSSSVSRIAPPINCGNGVVEEDLGETCDEGRFNGLSPLCDRWCNQTYCGDGLVHAEDEECEPVRQEDGTFAAQTCGGRTCTIPLCSANGSCYGGCHWVFLPACQVDKKPIITLFPNQVIQNETEVPESSSVAAASPAFNGGSSSASANLPVWTPPMSLPVFSIGLPPSSSSSSSSDSSAVCGNGVREADELCDDGPRNSDTLPDSCRTTCRNPVCGDKTVDYGEECDDGNDIIGDGCTPLCTRSACGNGVLEPGEECDDGPLNSATKPDSCSDRCLMPRCGDGVMDASFGEACDQGEDNSNTVPNHCRLNCLRPHCGDGVMDDNEECDDGNASNLDSCSISCKKIGCGNGVQDWNEACDDGNVANGDGCNASCQVEKLSILQWLNKAIRLPFGW